MRTRSLTRLFSIAVALLAIVLVAMALGSVAHFHAGSSDQTCQICHLNHQPVERPLVVSRAPVLILAGETPATAEADFAPAPVARRVPTRAPPSA